MVKEKRQRRRRRERDALSCSVCAGAELHARLAVPEEVEDHCPGLHLLPSRREHEEEEPDRLQHGGGGDRVRPPAVHPGQLLPQAAPHGRQLQETSHQPRRRQQHLPQQVSYSHTNICSSSSYSDLRPAPSLYSETIMFLHEIFHQGLKARIANWPTLVLGE